MNKYGLYFYCAEFWSEKGDFLLKFDGVFEPLGEIKEAKDYHEINNFIKAKYLEDFSFLPKNAKMIMTAFNRIDNK